MNLKETKQLPKKMNKITTRIQEKFQIFRETVLNSTSNMTTKKVNCNVRRNVLNFLVILGFLYQTFNIMTDYFNYPTLTIVTMEKAMPKTQLPVVVLMTRLTDQSSIGRHVSEVFSSIKDNMEIINRKMRSSLLVCLTE